MRLQHLCLILSVGGLLLGCGGGASDAPSLVEATGTVLLDGKPVVGASVTFVVEKSPISTGITDSAGKFTLNTGGRSGVPVGNAKVGIVKMVSTSGATATSTPADMMKMAAAGKMGPTKPKGEIPMKYADPDKSTLVAIIDKDPAKNVFEYKLVD